MLSFSPASFTQETEDSCRGIDPAMVDEQWPCCYYLRNAAQEKRPLLECERFFSPVNIESMETPFDLILTLFNRTKHFMSPLAETDG